MASTPTGRTGTGCNRRRRRGLTEEVRHECAARQQVGTVFAHANAALRVARNVPSDFGEPGDSLLSVVPTDGHEVVGARARLEQRGALVGRTRA